MYGKLNSKFFISLQTLSSDNFPSQPGTSDLLATLGGEFVTITSGHAELAANVTTVTSSRSEAKVIKADIDVPGGIVHAVDQVL